MIAFILVSLIIFMYVIRLILSILNYKHRTQSIPDNVKHVYDEESYQKWLAYDMENFRFSLITNTVNLVISIVFLLSGFFGLLEQISNQISSGPIISNLIFLGLYFLITFFIGIPFSYYDTFKIEERYGFNKQTLKGFISDKIKNLILVVILGGGVVSLLNFLYIQFDQMFFLFAWIALVLIMLIMLMLNTKVFVKLFNKLTPLEDGELKTRIYEFVELSGYKIKSISTMDASKRSTKLNAFFSGFGKFKEIVLFDTLIEKLTVDEVIAVLAHEIAHGKHKDVLRMFIQQILVFGLYAFIIGLVVSSDALAQAFGLSSAHFGFGLLLFFILINPIDMILSLLFNHFSRVAEYKADRYAAQSGYLEAMKSALTTLARENFANLTPHPLYVLFYYSHPSISNRIQSLDKERQS
jgi:STE24 endopeptidase